MQDLRRMETVISRVTEPDIPVIQKIAFETWPSTFGSILSKEQIDYMLNMMYSSPALFKQIHEQGHVFLLIRQGDVYQGYISYQLNYEGRSLTKIHKIYILPSAQGKGTGRALMNEVEKIARLNGNASLTLNVNKFNPAVIFYENLGFKTIGYEDIDIGNGYWMEDAILEKQL